MQIMGNLRYTLFKFNTDKGRRSNEEEYLNSSPLSSPDRSEKFQTDTLRNFDIQRINYLLFRRLAMGKTMERAF